MRLLAAVAVLDRRQHELPIVTCRDDRFGDLRKVTADFVRVRVAPADLVEVELLKEVEIRLRSFARPRIPRVEESAAVGVPREAAAGRAAVHARDDVLKLAATGDVEDVHVAALVAADRERDGDARSIRRRLVEIDGGPAARIERRRIDDDPLRPKIVGRSHHDDHRLLARRLLFDREELAAAVLEVAPSRARVGADRLHARPQRRHERQRVELRVRVGVLRVRPRLDLAVVPAFEPAVRIGDLDAVIGVDDRTHRCR